MRPEDTKTARKRVFTILTLVLASMAVLVCPTAVSAADPIDPAHLCSLQLHIDYGGNNIQGMTYDIYYVGTGDESSSFALAGLFAGYPVNLTGLSASGWQVAADQLAGYADTDGIAPTATATSDASGMVYYSNLPHGLYLVVGEDYVSGYSLFQVSPFLVALPHLQDDGSWLYDVMAYPKITDPVTIPGGSPGPTIPVTTLPQTGWLWWPVPLLAVLGIILFGFGWWRRYRLGEGNEEQETQE